MHKPIIEMPIVEETESRIVFSTKDWFGSLNDEEKESIQLAYSDIMYFLWRLCNIVVSAVDNRLAENADQIRLAISNDMMDEIVGLELNLDQHYEFCEHSERMRFVKGHQDDIASAMRQFNDYHLDLLIEPLRHFIIKRNGPLSNKRSIDYNLQVLKSDTFAIRLSFF